MGILDRLRGIDRRYWYVCYNCMMQTAHDVVNSVFYSEAPLTPVLGRPLMPCPRCASTNTKSFQNLKDEGAEAPLWGLEQTVRKHRRSQFVVKAQTISSPPPAGSETRSSVN